MRRLFAPAILASLLPMAARADGLALVLGTADYAALDDVARGGQVADAAAELADAGFRVLALEDGGAEGVARTLGDFMAAVPDSDRLLVALSGRFVTDGSRTWYLTRDAEPPRLFGLDERAIPVEGVLQVLARAPSRAVLVLGVDPGAEAAFDPWLREGLGRLEIPQGVTVLTGTPRAVANLLAGPLSEPGADLSHVVAGTQEVDGAGYLPQGFVFVPDGAEPEPGRPGRDAEETALWQGALALNTEEAFRNYLDAYPQGRYAAAARDAIAAILAEPNREQRLSEEALDLTREERRAIQQNLSVLDFDPRGIDGIFGPGTRRAITDWQQQNGFGQTSFLDAEQVERLAAQAARRTQQIEAEAERAREAAERADRAAWEETGARGDEAGLRAYLERYPEGLFAQNARERLAAMEADRARIAAAQDQAAWDAAREADTAGAYRRYLEAFPEGRFAAEARARLGSEAGGVAGREEATAEARAAEEALGLNALTSRVLEQRLDALGLDPGAVDGRFDADTRAALRAYQRDRGLPQTGFVNETTLVRLLADTLGQALRE